MDKPFTLHNSDALEVMKSLPDNSVSLIATDPPYYKVKDEPWDNQWETPENFLSWMDLLAKEWQRILKPNGSIYVFASPQMSARVEVLLSKHFNILNNIRWIKDAGWHQKTDKEAIKSYLSPYESVIFSEQFKSDIVSYMRSERDKAGVTDEQIDNACGWRTQAFHYFAMSDSNFIVPSLENYLAIQKAYQGYFTKAWSEISRPFNSSTDVQFSDVWNYPTVTPYNGKHPCEKPAAMMEHIVSMSSNPDEVVLDCFMGTGATGAACGRLRRKFIGIEKVDLYFRKAHRRIATAYRQFDQVHILKPSVQSLEGLPLFNGGG